MRAIAILLTFAFSGCATLNPGPFWTKAEDSLVKRAIIHETRNPEFWCNLRFPGILRGCAGERFREEGVIYIRKGLVTDALIAHEKCHLLGYDHAEPDRMGSGDAPCPEDTTKLPHTFGGDL